jgi:hypothetical protein
MAIKYKKWPQTTPNGHKIYQHIAFKGPQNTPKYTHLATLIAATCSNKAGIRLTHPRKEKKIKLVCFN